MNVPVAFRLQGGEKFQLSPFLKRILVHEAEYLRLLI